MSFCRYNSNCMCTNRLEIFLIFLVNLFIIYIIIFSQLPAIFSLMQVSQLLAIYIRRGSNCQQRFKISFPSPLFGLSKYSIASNLPIAGESKVAVPSDTGIITDSYLLIALNLWQFTSHFYRFRQYMFINVLVYLNYFGALKINI